MKHRTLLVLVVVLSLLMIPTPANASTTAVGHLANAQTFTVNSTGDLGDGIPGNGVCETPTPGECTLRAAIMESNASPGTDTISFNIPGSGPHTVSPSYGFDFISDPVIIDGTTQPGYAGTPIIELDGSSAGAGIGGLTILAGSSTVRGLVINRFDGYGMRLDTNGNNLVQGNFLGTDATGTVDLGNSGFGILIVSGSSGNMVGGTSAGARNIVSGNGDWGITIVDLGTTGNFVQGNFIGTDVSGRFALPNGGGVGIFTSATDNQIGGTAAGAGNVVSGNGGNGIVIGGNGSNSNTVQGNFVGTDVTGTVDLGNFYEGVQIASGAANNTIGGPTDGARNIISGNDGSGLRIYDTATQNIVQGNFIGTDISGTLDLGNSIDGVGIDSNDNLIGGTAASARNVISGNDRGGVTIFGANANENVVQGNYIGTDANGSASLANYSGGVVIGVGASGNTIGGMAAGAGNLLSGNGDLGVLINDTGTEHNVIQGNFIGTDEGGSASIPNNNGGVRIGNGATNNSIGPGNVISGNGGSGLVIEGSSSSANIVEGNIIGADVTGTLNLGNADDGVLLLAPNNTIGGTTSTARNIISGNQEQGIRMQGSEASGNVVQGNFIGVDSTGTIALGNGTDCCHSGVVMHLGASNNTIGGITPGAGNVISGNTADGITIFDAGTTQNVVSGNFIGTDVTGTQGLGNSFSGVAMFGSTSDNLIGGTEAGAGNVISGNTADGITITDGGTTGNVVAGNFIGTDVNGIVGIANATGGVGIFSGTTDNLIGGTTAAARNIISGNGGTGVNICCDGATRNLVKGNFIGTDVSGTLALGNAGDGVSIYQSADNTIGGIEPGARNLISGNQSHGVGIYDAGTTGNLVQGNYVGTDVTGMIAIGNSLDAVVICCNGASANTVGGTALGAGNLISGNVGNGIGIYDDTTANVVQGNLIGTNATGTGSLGNGGNGIGIAGGPTNNLIGGTTNGARNTIAFNGANGVSLTSDAGTGNIISSNSIYSNGSLGIDLGENGVTLDDLFDADSGPNNLQNFPFLNTAKSASKGTLIQGALLSTRNTTFRLEFFSNNACDPSGYGEGQTYLGFVNVTTNSTGHVNFNITLPTSLTKGNFITATATDPANSTSEFSQCVMVTK
jgi:titin